MEMLTNLLGNFSNFSLVNLQEVLLNPVNLGYILTLIIMEGLLSCDNALVLAMLVRHLPKEKQKKALFYGIWGAYIFRFIAIGLGTYLIKLLFFKLLAIGYLMYMTIKYFFFKDENNDGINDAVQKSFWATVLQIELMDIAFSVDSVAAAFGVSSQPWVIFLGAVFGILAMRGVSNLFVALLQKVPELESTAYVLIGCIAVKMGLQFWIEIPDFLFLGLLVVVFLSTFAVHKYNVLQIAKSQS